MNFLVKMLLIIIISNSLFSQQLSKNSEKFFFDAICFKNIDSSKKESSRVDIYGMIPYQSLQFEKYDDKFIAKFDLVVEVYDTNAKKIISKRISRNVIEQNYFVTQGGTAAFDEFASEVYLNPGMYNIQLSLIDKLSNVSETKSRDISVIDFNRYDISISGILLISSIEENKGKYLITPHISDNIANLSDGFFIFFELYNNSLSYSKIKTAYEILDENKNIIKSEIFDLDVSENLTRHYKRIKLDNELKQGFYNLKLLALKPEVLAHYSELDYLAITERSLKYYPLVSGYSIDDLDKAIKYLRYVAEQSDIEYIESATNFEEKQKRFKEFWKNLDPSPNTERNEAFDQYYARIDYVNKNFKSYNEGWLTDMGMVYIIYGPPTFVDQPAYYNQRGSYIKWTYSNNRIFIFIDYTGLGDFRLSTNTPVRDKYRYQN